MGWGGAGITASKEVTAAGRCHRGFSGVLPQRAGCPGSMGSLPTSGKVCKTEATTLLPLDMLVLEIGGGTG